MWSPTRSGGLAKPLACDPGQAFAEDRRHRGLGAHLALAHLGDYLIVFSEVTISGHRRHHMRHFERAAEAVPEIMEC